MFFHVSGAEPLCVQGMIVHTNADFLIPDPRAPPSLPLAHG